MKLTPSSSGPAKNRQRRSWVLGWSQIPSPVMRIAPKTKTANRQFTTQRDSSAGSCERTRYFCFHIRSPEFTGESPIRVTRTPLRRRVRSRSRCDGDASACAVQNESWAAAEASRDPVFVSRSSSFLQCMPSQRSSVTRDRMK